VNEPLPEGVLYECQYCGRAWRAQASQGRQECPSCHSGDVKEVEVEEASNPRPGLLQRLLRKRSP
jgi:rubrerythrin